MRSHRYPRSHEAPSSAFAGYRFPPEVITLAVRWYLRFGLSYRDVEELLAERGICVDHVTVYRWVHRFAPEFAEAANARRHIGGDRWHVDETYVKVGGTWRYLFRDIDQWSSRSRTFRWFVHHDRGLYAGGVPLPGSSAPARAGRSVPERMHARGAYPSVP